MRQVRDAVVADRLKVVKVSDAYINELERYKQPVSTTLERVDFDLAPLGVSAVEVCDSLKSNYAAVRIVGDECYVKVGDIKKMTTPVRMRILKALALEQLNPNPAYSFIVASIFKQLLLSVMKGEEPVWKKPFEYLENSCIYDELVSWIAKEESSNE